MIKAKQGLGNKVKALIRELKLREEKLARIRANNKNNTILATKKRLALAAAQKAKLEADKIKAQNLNLKKLKLAELKAE